MSITDKKIREIYPDIMRVALNLTRYNRENAEDLVQKALMKAFEKQELFKGGNLVGWIVTIMKNIFRDELRKIKGKEFVEVSDDDLDDGEYKELDDIEEKVEAGIRASSVKKALKRMTGNCKEILSLFSQEYKYKEISDHIGIPMGTVMNRLSRCRKKLHQELYGMSEYNEI
jgi:RNA polymerase sigma-70 factor (ECF subfamily)